MKYAANWREHAAHSDPYAGKETKDEKPTAEEKKPKPDPAAGDAAAGGYVASMGSQVLHRAGCEAAAKISEKNVVKFATRDDALGSGRRPCAECKP